MIVWLWLGLFRSVVIFKMRKWPNRTGTEVMRTDSSWKQQRSWKQMSDHLIPTEVGPNGSTKKTKTALLVNLSIQVFVNQRIGAGMHP